MPSGLEVDRCFTASQDLVDALQPFGSELTHPAGKMLFARGDSARGLFLLISGSARISVPGALDRAVGTRALLGVPGTLSKGTYSLEAVLLEESRVLFVPSERVSALLVAHPEVGFHLVQILSREIQAIRERITTLSGTEARI